MSESSTLRERVYSRLIPCDCGCNCLIWTGAITKAGYGRVFVGRRADGSRRVDFVHRVVWELEHGQVPDGKQVDHVKARGCVHRHCGKLAHLEPVTQLENTRRGGNAAKTHCPQNHEYTPENTYIGPTDGDRYCRRCSQDKYLARRDPSKPLGWRTGGQTRSRLPSRVSLEVS